MPPKYDGNDVYIDALSGVLKNNLDITEDELLAEAEADFVSFRLLELSEVEPDNLDFSFLKAIHFTLFQDMYDWAGQVRTVPLSKEGSRFAQPEFIEPEAKKIFDGLAREEYLKGLSKEIFCERAAYYLGELNALHPFREGNGRTQREFINFLAKRNGYLFDWRKTNQEEMRIASIEAMASDPIKFAVILKKCLNS